MKIYKRVRNSLKPVFYIVDMAGIILCELDWENSPSKGKALLTYIKNQDELMLLDVGTHDFHKILMLVYPGV